tara:strand:+ start:683 stop:973 length:291 start_codon:yes stop_codon:yes gene_type:complete
MLTNLDWEGALPTLLEVAKNGTSAKGRREAFDSLKIMARLADCLGKEMIIEVHPQGRAVVRAEGEEPIFEFKNLSKAAMNLLIDQYPMFTVRMLIT